MDKLRDQKDHEISQLKQKFEEMRYEYESKVDELTITIETMEKQILVQNGTITGLESELYQKRDVDQQL